MNRITINLGLILATIALVFGSNSAVILALPNQISSTNTSNKSSSEGDNGKNDLSAAQLKSCQKHEHVIDNILKRIADRGQKQVDLFSTIASRTEDFYSTKGKTLENYNLFVTNLAANKVAAQTAVNVIKQESADFKCSDNNPKGIASAFKKALKTEISVLRNYRSAVKNFVVAVRTLESSKNSSTSNRSLTPPANALPPNAVPKSNKGSN